MSSSPQPPPAMAPHHSELNLSDGRQGLHALWPSSWSLTLPFLRHAKPAPGKHLVTANLLSVPAHTPCPIHPLRLCPLSCPVFTVIDLLQLTSQTDAMMLVIASHPIYSVITCQCKCFNPVGWYSIWLPEFFSYCKAIACILPSPFHLLKSSPSFRAQFRSHLFAN